jgi:stage II sporulation protein AA (anti-sigma F factor antagonist)
MECMHCDDVLVVRPCRDFDEQCGRQLRDIIRAARKPGLPPLVVISLKNVSFISSSGLGCLVALLRELRDAGGHLVLAAVEPTVCDVFSLAGLERLFRFADDEAAGKTQVRRAAAASAEGT